MPDVPVLGFDTSAAHCAAAFLSGDKVVTSRREEMSRGQAERLFPMMEEILGESGYGWRDLQVIGVGIGPGNFTGVRVAVATARGLALSLNIPAIGVSVTEAMAYGLQRPCRIVIPARRDQVIWQDFHSPGQQDGEPQQSAITSLPPGPSPAEPAMPLAEAIAHIALARRAIDHPAPAPVYLRPADAAPSRDAPPVILP